MNDARVSPPVDKLIETLKEKLVAGVLNNRQSTEVILEHARNVSDSFNTLSFFEKQDPDTLNENKTVKNWHKINHG
jgi:hypothetical protein